LAALAASWLRFSITRLIVGSVTGESFELAAYFIFRFSGYHLGLIRKEL
jgi:hypothetical protein